MRGPNDLCAILYTSGTTGKPKGCMHTHASVMFTAVGGAIWEGMSSDSVVLATAPFFHVTGMQHSMNAAIFSGASIALLPRWDPEAAGHLFERLRCTHWANVPTMVVDLLAHPSTAGRDLSSLQNVFGGGAAMPEVVAQQLFERCGVEYMEAYGMTETISQTHMNPPGGLRKQCLGIPTFDTESLIIDPDTGQPLGPPAGPRCELKNIAIQGCARQLCLELRNFRLPARRGRRSAVVPARALPPFVVLRRSLPIVVRLLL